VAVRRWGVTLPLDSVPLRKHHAIVERLEELGYTDAWSSEASATDAFTPLALTAAWSTALRLGTAITPVYTRGPALLAMSAAALAEAAPGRFVLGVGASTPIIVERWNATPFGEPYRRTRDTVRFLRRALAGERVDERFESFVVRGFRLDRPPETAPPILVAALRPGMLRLGVREADGVITNCLASTDVPRVVAALGSEGAGKEVVARIFVCPTEDSRHARRLGRRLLSTYLTVPVYADFHRWLGRGEVLEPMWQAWAAGDRKAANAAIPDEVVDELVLHGTPDQCRARVQRYVDNGITTPVLALLPAGDSGAGDALAAAERALQTLAPPALA
jgi:probable F420-dependent oxidoreductase